MRFMELKTTDILFQMFQGYVSSLKNAFSNFELWRYIFHQLIKFYILDYELPRL